MGNSIDIKTWFATELRDRMDEMQLRPYHIAFLYKIDESDVRSWLKGASFPGLFNLIMLADRFECTVNDLLGFEEIEETEVYERYTASSMFFAEYQYAVCLADRMRRYLENQNISFPDLADKTGFTATTLRRWFAKTHPCLPSTEKFLHICSALDCTPSELLGY